MTWGEMNNAVDIPLTAMWRARTINCARGSHGRAFRRLRRGPTAGPRSLRRGESQTVDCTSAVIVLRADGPQDFYVLTTYPEARE